MLERILLSIGEVTHNKAGHAAHYVRWTRYTAFRSPVPAALLGLVL